MIATARLSVVIAPVLLVACASTPAAPWQIRVADLPPRPTYDSSWIQNERAAAAVAMAVMERELQMSRPDVTLRFFPDRDAFREALVANGYEASFAAETASRMDAIGGHRQVMFNAAALSTLQGPPLAAFMAHELTHTLQYELAGGRRGTSEQWLREGFADWVAARVLAATGAMTLEEFELQRIRRFRSARIATLPGLEQMVSFQQWVGLAVPETSAALGAKAFLAVDFLVERHGLRRVLEYFSKFAKSDDRRANFTETFGESLTAFEMALNAHLATVR